MTSKAQPVNLFERLGIMGLCLLMLSVVVYVFGGSPLLEIHCDALGWATCLRSPGIP